MKSAAPISSLPELLEKEVTDLLSSCQIHDIGNYGWLDEHTPDPELLGHAMWQVEPPLEFEYHSAFGEAPVQHRPTEYEEVLTVSGADFEGLMRLAYRSIGLTLWHASSAENAPFSENHYFSLHYVNTMSLLNIASDRLREFFVMAYFQKTARKYEKTDREHRLFQTPFMQATGHAHPSIQELLSKIAAISSTIFQNRKDRNRIVHEITTKLGVINRDSTLGQRQRFDEQLKSGFKKRERPTFELTVRRGHDVEDLHKREIRNAGAQIVEWYKTLVQASSYAFEAEHRLRRLRSQTKATSLPGDRDK